MYKTVLHSKMKEFPDESVAVFTTCREEIRMKATIHVKLKPVRGHIENIAWLFGNTHVVSKSVRNK